MKRYILFFLMTCTFLTAAAQESKSRSNIRNGNREYRKERYENAETKYRKAIETDSTYYRGQYNLGNTLYKQKHYEEAVSHYQKAIENPKMDQKQRRDCYHNLGNSYLQAGLKDRQNGMQHFQQAVNSYQEAMKLDPKNEDTRYNLSYAKKLLAQAQQQQQNQQNQNGGGQQNQDQQNKDQQGQGQQNQDQNKDQQNKGQQNKDQQNQNQQNKNQQNQNQQQKQNQQQQQAQKQKKEDAERLLEAVRNNEKNTMKDQNKKVAVGQAGRIEKDW